MSTRLFHHCRGRCSTSWQEDRKRSRLSVEANEDLEELGERDIARRRPTRKDMVIGISASAATPMLSQPGYASARGAKTAAVTCNQGSPTDRAPPTSPSLPKSAPGRCRFNPMKAGTAQKMILNMITTGAMTRLGYVYENLMVNVHMQNSKLVERGIRILKSACKWIRKRPSDHQGRGYERSRGAMVMLKAGVDKAGSGSPTGEVGRQCAPCD